jgi:hypothetical protein
VAELITKSGITARGNWRVWLGCPEAPKSVTFTVYAAGAVVLGTFKASVSARTVFAVIASGSDGVTAH